MLMQPTQNPYQPQVDPYAFLNQAGKSRYSFNPLKNLFSGGNGSSFKRKLMLFGGVVIALIILIVILKIALGGNSNINLPSIYAVLGEEQEIINLSQSGQQSSSQANLNFAYTALGSVTTDQTNLTKLLSKNGIGVSPGQLILQPSADNQLKQASASGDFDSVYVSVMQTQLKLYQSNLAKAYSLTSSSVLKSYLNQDYKNAALLLKMLNNAYV